MICQKCGSQLNMDGTCPNCGQGNVRIMEKSEINAYDGITIEENSYEQENARTEKNDSSFEWQSAGQSTFFEIDLYREET